MSKRKRRREPSPGERKVAWRERLSERMAELRPEPPAPARRARDDEPQVVLHPRLRPRGVADALVALGVVLAQLIVLLVVPVLVWRVVDRSTPVTVVLGIAVFVAELIALVRALVRSMTLDARGIRLERLVGRPKFIAWKDVTFVRRADRVEAVMSGIALPLEHSDATRSLTSLGHFAILYRAGTIYFPPADEAAFLAAVRRWAPLALAPEFGGKRRV
jgi:hypothetical protein